MHDADGRPAATAYRTTVNGGDGAAGVRPPEASWGALLQVAYNNINRNSFQAIPPGVAIMLCVLAFNLLGDGIRDSLGKEIRRGT